MTSSTTDERRGGVTSASVAKGVFDQIVGNTACLIAPAAIRQEQLRDWSIPAEQSIDLRFIDRAVLASSPRAFDKPLPISPEPHAQWRLSTTDPRIPAVPFRKPEEPIVLAARE
ncbi:MAG: hypothetical protein AAGE86_07685 [Pseudomonadota bacterium]